MKRQVWMVALWVYLSTGIFVSLAAAQGQVQIWPASPGGRVDFGLVGLGDGRVVLQGGTRDGLSALSDTWIGVPSPRPDCGVSWLNLVTTGVAPPVYGAHWDYVRDRLLVVGGAQGGPAPCSNLVHALNDVTSPTPTWVQFPSMGDPPAARWNFGGAYDGVAQRLFVWGGNNCGGTNYNNLYLGTVDFMSQTVTWNQGVQTGDMPSPRDSFAFEPIYNQVSRLTDVGIFGGKTINGMPLNDTYTAAVDQETGAFTWTRNVTANTPPARFGPAAYSDPLNRFCIFGGSSGFTGLLDDLWCFNGTDWQQQLVEDAFRKYFKRSYATGVVPFGWSGPFVYGGLDQFFNPLEEPYAFTLTPGASQTMTPKR